MRHVSNRHGDNRIGARIDRLLSLQQIDIVS